jgi:hypothetical protein
MKSSPRPWSINPVFDFSGKSWFGIDPSPILDANGNDVIYPSEWLTITKNDAELIVKAVNSYTEEDAVCALETDDLPSPCPRCGATTKDNDNRKCKKDQIHHE